VNIIQFLCVRVVNLSFHFGNSIVQKANIKSVCNQNFSAIITRQSINMHSSKNSKQQSWQ